MPFLTIEDLYTRIYEENVDTITRENDSIAERALSSAIQEVKMYLSRYNILALFGDADTEPTVNDEYLKTLCIDIAVYRLIALCNVEIDYEKAKDTYSMTLQTLKNIQKGLAQPEGWPYKDTTGQTAPQGNSVHASYTRKRNNDF